MTVALMLLGLAALGFDAPGSKLRRSPAKYLRFIAEAPLARGFCIWVHASARNDAH